MIEFLTDSYASRVDRYGKVLIPEKLRIDRVFFAYFYTSMLDDTDSGLCLWPECNLNDPELKKVPCLRTSMIETSDRFRVELDRQGRADISEQCAYSGMDVYMLGRMHYINIIPALLRPDLASFAKRMPVRAHRQHVE